MILVNVLYLNNHRKRKPAKVITPISETGQDENASDNIMILDDATQTSFIPLLATENFISAVSADFDGDTFDDQVVAVRKAGSQFVYLIFGLYNPDTNNYSRVSEIPTEISRLKTFSYYSIDMIGNHRNSLVYQGIKDSGESVMKIFICRKKTGRAEVKNIGDFSSEGTIYIQQADRSDAYELSQSWGAPHKVWVYTEQLRIEYRYDAESDEYIESRRVQITESKVVAQELERLRRDGIPAFGKFLTGLWYRTTNNTADTRYIYFNYDEKEIIFLSDETEGVYSWENSSLLRSGIYLTTVNKIISSMKLRFDIMMTGINEVSIYVHENVGMVIKESNEWNGSYKKMSFQTSFGDVKIDESYTEFLDAFKSGEWLDENENKYTFEKNCYEVDTKDGRIVENGSFVAETIGKTPILQFRTNHASSIFSQCCSLSYETKEITIPAKKPRQKARKEILVNKDTIILTPVKISPLDCQQIEGKIIVLKKKQQSNEQ